MEVAPAYSPPTRRSPAVLARHGRLETEHQSPDPVPGLDPIEPARDPVHQAYERLLPSSRVYAVACGLRMIFSLHTLKINGGRLVSSAGTCAKSGLRRSAIFRGCRRGSHG